MLAKVSSLITDAPVCISNDDLPLMLSAEIDTPTVINCQVDISNHDVPLMLSAEIDTPTVINCQVYFQVEQTKLKRVLFSVSSSSVQFVFNAH